MPLIAFLVERFLILVSNAAGETLPSLEIKYAATPATWGVAMEVPEMLLVACKTAKAQCQPSLNMPSMRYVQCCCCRSRKR
jgi:hypothetical protein